ncbi:MAG: aryl-sulfate sulfotransferase [bacterium]|nr:aryl-sulfate sulfotransferase [bacterium]
MAAGKTRQDTVGLIHYEPDKCYRGYTLFCGGNPACAYLIDMNGSICHRWTNERGIVHAKLLNNGNLVCRGAIVPLMEGQRGTNAQASCVFELNWQGELVWEYRDDHLHHDHERLPNGNTLLITWRLMSEEMSKRIQGGYPSDDDDPQMLGDVVLEVTPGGDVVKEWCSWDHLDPEVDTICPIEHRREWTHFNSISVTPEGDWLVSARRTNTVATIDPQSGEVTSRWGPGVVSHQHDARILGNGNLLVFDNGVHNKTGSEFSRVLEVKPDTREIVWEYQADPPWGFFSFMAGGADRLPNGNTLICHSSAGRFFEVTSRKEIVWEYVNPFYTPNKRTGGRHNMSFRANRFGPDHAALADKELNPDRYGNLNRLY